MVQHRLFRFLLLPILVIVSGITGWAAVQYLHSPPHKHHQPAMPSSQQSKDSSQQSLSPMTTRISIAAVGDLMSHGSQIQSGKRDSAGKTTYNFDHFFAEITPLLSSADLTMGNLETVTAGKEATFTGYPAFNTPNEYVVACKNAGFDVLTTANNHSFDRAYLGVSRTIRLLDSLGISYTGTTTSLTDRSKPLVINVKGINIGIIAYAYGLNNGAAPAKYRTTVNIVDTTAIGADIDWLRALPASQRPALLFACVHWGDEYQLKPNRKQQTLAQYLLERGVDVVLGSHPHVVQTVERRYVKRGNDSVLCAVVYSMGNFISGQRPVPRETGVITWFDVERNEQTGVARLVGTGFTPTYIHKSSAKGKPFYTVFSVPDALQRLEQKTLDLPAAVVTRLGKALQEITRQCSTPDGGFVLRK
jgi:poly-gamma-glutamate synthesis protein (capsule biosynthesis protein)